MSRTFTCDCQIFLYCNCNFLVKNAFLGVDAGDQDAYGLFSFIGLVALVAIKSLIGVVVDSTGGNEHLYQFFLMVHPIDIEEFYNGHRFELYQEQMEGFLLLNDFI